MYYQFKLSGCLKNLAPLLWHLPVFLCCHCCGANTLTFYNSPFMNEDIYFNLECFLLTNSELIQQGQVSYKEFLENQATKDAHWLMHVLLMLSN